MDILNLAKWNTLKVEESTNDYRITAEYTDQHPICPYCGCYLLDRHGKLPKLAMDTPIHGKRVGILIQQQRYKCQSCKKTFLQELPDIDEKHEMTKRLMGYIVREALKQTFTALSDAVGVNEKTIRNIFDEHIAEVEKKRVVETPEWMGIDELKICQAYRCIFSDVMNRRMFEILKNRKKATITGFLSALPFKNRVRLMCMDMTDYYREITNALLPMAQIVVDKFHVVKLANTAVNQVRMAVREGISTKQQRQLMHDRFLLYRHYSNLDEREAFILDTWTKNFPALADAYALKEEFFNIFELTCRPQAERTYAQWCNNVTSAVKFAFIPIMQTVAHWHDEIFAYFDHQATNAYTESLNGLARVVNHVGRGYSFEVLRAKMLYYEGIGVIHRPAYGVEFSYYPMEKPIPHLFDPPIIYSGIGISTITRAAEDGLLDPPSTLKSE